MFLNELSETEQQEIRQAANVLRDTLLDYRQHAEQFAQEQLLSQERQEIIACADLPPADRKESALRILAYAYDRRQAAALADAEPATVQPQPVEQPAANAEPSSEAADDQPPSHDGWEEATEG